MTKPKHADIEAFDQADMVPATPRPGQMSREEVEAWGRAGWELALRLAQQLEQEPQIGLRTPSKADRRKRDKKRARKRLGK